MRLTSKGWPGGEERKGKGWGREGTGEERKKVEKRGGEGPRLALVCPRMVNPALISATEYNLISLSSK